MSDQSLILPRYNLPQALTAPFRSRSANPDGFDSKMKSWINAIEEWSSSNRKLAFSLKEIHKTFVSDSGVRPDKESIRLVLSEMKRRNLAAPLSSLKSCKFWTSSDPLLDNYVDTKSWVGWSVKKLVYDPASWALSSLSGGQNQTYSDLTDLSLADDMKFVSQKSLHGLAHNLLAEFVRIAKAEEQFCFEWKHLIELITPIMNTIIDATDSKELSDTLDILIDYLENNRLIAIQADNDTKLVKVANPDDSEEKTVMITQKDIATARLLRAKELLTASADRYHEQALRAKQAALECYNKKEVARAKSLLRSHKRFTEYANQKETQLTNVEVMLEQLETTDSNMMILQAYKDGANALKIANTNLESNTSILDEMHDVTAEAKYLNDEMSRMLNDISHLSHGIHDTTNADLEAELNDMMKEDATDKFVDELEQKLSSLVVCQDPPETRSQLEAQTTPEAQPELESKSKIMMPATAT